MRGLESETARRHRDGDRGLDPDHDGLRAAQPGGRSQAAQSMRGEGVDDVQSCDIDDHSTCSLPADLLHEVALEPDQLAVVERGVDGRDEVTPLRKDRDAQGSCVSVPVLVVDIKIAGHYEAERLLGLHASKSDNAKS